MTKSDLDALNEQLAKLSTSELLSLSAVQEKIGDVRDIVINVLPEDIRQNHLYDASDWDVHVVYRGENSYAVENRGRQYTKDLNPGMETLPSSRTERFKKSHRFTLDQALALAHKLAPKVKVAGMTADQYLLWIQAGEIVKERYTQNPQGEGSYTRDEIMTEYNKLKEAKEENK